MWATRCKIFICEQQNFFLTCDQRDVEFLFVIKSDFGIYLWATRSFYFLFVSNEKLLFFICEHWEVSIFLFVSKEKFLFFIGEQWEVSIFYLRETRSFYFYLWATRSFYFLFVSDGKFIYFLFYLWATGSLYIFLCFKLFLICDQRYVEFLFVSKSDLGIYLWASRSFFFLFVSNEKFLFFIC